MTHMAANSGSGNAGSTSARLKKKTKCVEAQELFSPYLDGAVTGNEMRDLREHLDACSACSLEYALIRKTQQLLASAGRPSLPMDLGLKLRLAISREAALSRRPRFEGLRVRLENTLNAFMVPATAGLVCAVVIFGLVATILAIPGQLQANNEDVPLVLNTGPELQESSFGTMSSINAESLVIEAYVDSHGRVEDYKILSDPSASQELLPQVKRMLIFTTFRPAMSMGHPISSRAVLSFSRISVQG